MTTVEHEQKKEQELRLLNKKALIVGPDDEIRQAVIERMELEGATVTFLEDPSVLEIPFEDLPATLKSTDIIVNLTLNSQQTEQLFRIAEPLLAQGASVVNLVFNTDELKRYSLDKSLSLRVEIAGIIERGESFAKKLGPRGRCNFLLIGLVDTEEFFELLPPEWQDKEKISKTRALQGIPPVAEVMNLLVFLASDESSYINGEAVLIGGPPIGFG